jgi:thymidine kinase
MVIRLDADGNAITEGSQVDIGGNTRYVSMCRRHFKENFLRPEVRTPAKVQRSDG